MPLFDTVLPVKLPAALASKAIPSLRMMPELVTLPPIFPLISTPLARLGLPLVPVIVPLLWKLPVMPLVTSRLPSPALMTIPAVPPSISPALTRSPPRVPPLM
jgi:hypothetical protein